MKRLFEWISNWREKHLLPRVEIKKRASILIAGVAALLMLWIDSFSNGRSLPEEITFFILLADFGSFASSRSLIFFAGLFLTDMYSAGASGKTSQFWSTALSTAIGSALVIVVALILLFSSSQVDNGILTGKSASIAFLGLVLVGLGVWMFFGLVSEVALIKSRESED